MATRNAEIVVTKRKMANVWNVGTRNESPSFIVSRHAAQRKQIASAPAEMARQTGGLWHKVSGKNRWQSTRTDFSLCSFFKKIFFYVQIIFFFFFSFKELRPFVTFRSRTTPPPTRDNRLLWYFGMPHMCSWFNDRIDKKKIPPAITTIFFFYPKFRRGMMRNMKKKKVQDEAKANW